MRFVPKCLNVFFQHFKESTKEPGLILSYCPGPMLSLKDFFFPTYVVFQWPECRAAQHQILFCIFSLLEVLQENFNRVNY